MSKFTPKRLLAAAHRWLALAVVAVGAAVALSLGASWRDLGRDLAAALAAREGLEPAWLAARVQLSLATHRGAAAAVLAGHPGAEPERRHRQRAADDHLRALAQALEQRQLARALSESDALSHDWRQLLAGIQARRITPEASDLQHELLAEQVFVVGDLAAADSRLHSLVGRAVDGQALALATRELPRLAVAMAGASTTAPAGPGAPGAPPTAFDDRALAPLERRIERALARWVQSSAQRDLDVDELHAVLALQRLLGGAASAGNREAATAAAAAAGDRTVPGAAAHGTRTGQLQQARQRAEQVQQAAQRATVAILARLDRELAAATQVLQAERRLVASVLAFDVLLVLLAAASVAVRRPRSGAPAPAAPVAEPAAATPATSTAATARVADAAEAAGTVAARSAESQAPTDALIDRLRKPALDADTASGALGPR